MSVQDLFADRTSFVRSYVRVTGVIRIEQGQGFLYENEQEYEDPRPFRYIRFTLSEDQIADVPPNGSRVEIVGKFFTDLTHVEMENGERPLFIEDWIDVIQIGAGGS